MGILDKYIDDINKKNDLNHKICEKYINLLYESESELKTLFYPNTIKISKNDVSLDIYTTKNLFKRNKLITRILIQDHEMYVLQYNSLSPMCLGLWPEDNPTDTEIEDRLKICFSDALEELI